MPLVRIAAASVNQTPLDWNGNRDRLIAALDEARRRDVGVLCLPELAVTGYGCEDAFFSAGVQRIALELLAEILPATRELVATLGVPLLVDGKLHNACVVACHGRVVGATCKQHLAGDGIHYEPRWFHPWPAGQVALLEIAGREVPVGDLVFDCGSIRWGMEICRDAWVADRPGKRLVARGAQLLLNPSASHFAFAKQDIRRAFSLAAARDWGVAFVYSNLLGNESGRAIFDGGTLIAHGDRMVAEGPRFSYRDHVLTIADLPIEAPLRAAGRSKEVASPPAIVDCDWEIPVVTHPAPPSPGSPWDASPPPKYEEFCRAVALGLFDYLRKSRAGGLVVSSSGGADSSAVAVLAWLMVRFAVGELGRAETVARLPAVRSLANLPEAPRDDPGGLVCRILSCVYQATRNSSDTTRDAARQVARAIDANYLQWDIDPFVERYVETVATAAGRSIDWDTHDLALQNIQARARGPGVWLLANLTGSLLLATSNRSEAAVGYATMDGDTCGGLSPIAGIDKAFLLEWLDWMRRQGPEAVGPLPALEAVTVQTPTAELRPAAAGQTDEADLMPYGVLDLIERAAIRDRLLPVEVFREVLPQLPGVSAAQVGEWVERFFVLWRRNQWKRERYAPSFHLDDENLDPKTWCRFPILSGSLDRELVDLRAEVARGR
jgi:NAD+ synthase (glutamine-hydrolysing)